MKNLIPVILLLAIAGCSNHKGASTSRMVIRMTDSSELDPAAERYRFYYVDDTLQSYAQGIVGKFSYDSSAALGGNKWGRYYNLLASATDTNLVAQADTSVDSSSGKLALDRLIDDPYDLFCSISSLNDIISRSAKVDTMQMSKDSTGYLFTGGINNPMGLFDGEYVDSVTLLTVDKKLIQVVYIKEDLDDFTQDLINPQKDMLDFIYSGDTLKRINYYTIDSTKSLYYTSSFSYETKVFVAD